MKIKQEFQTVLLIRTLLTGSGSTVVRYFEYLYVLISIDVQVRLVHLVRSACLVHLQTDNFRWFLRQQMEKRQTLVYTVSKR